MSIFEFNDFRLYLRSYIKNLTNNGRGELARIARHLKINSTTLSQIMSGGRCFNPEQSCALSTYLGHSELERDFFWLLVQKDRAGTFELKKYLEKKIENTKKMALQLSKRITFEERLNNEQQAIFYSSWLYSAVHLMTSLSQKGVLLDEISRYLKLDKQKTSQIMQFLISAGLVKEKLGRYQMGVQSTFVERGSPHLLKHFSNWRLKAVHQSDQLKEDELMYSGQFSLSKKDFHYIREQVTELLNDTNKRVKDSPPEELAYLNVDWLRIE